MPSQLGRRPARHFNVRLSAIFTFVALGCVPMLLMPQGNLDNGRDFFASKSLEYLSEIAPPSGEIHESLTRTPVAREPSEVSSGEPGEASMADPPEADLTTKACALTSTEKCVSFTKDYSTASAESDCTFTSVKCSVGETRWVQCCPHHLRAATVQTFTCCLSERTKPRVFLYPDPHPQARGRGGPVMRSSVALPTKNVLQKTVGKAAYERWERGMIATAPDVTFNRESLSAPHLAAVGREAQEPKGEKEESMRSSSEEPPTATSVTSPASGSGDATRGADEEMGSIIAVDRDAGEGLFEDLADTPAPPRAPQTLAPTLSFKERKYRDWLRMHNTMDSPPPCPPHPPHARPRLCNVTVSIGNATRALPSADSARIAANKSLDENGSSDSDTPAVGARDTIGKTSNITGGIASIISGDMEGGMTGVVPLQSLEAQTDSIASITMLAPCDGCAPAAQFTPE
ncbi:hypothetical protein CYMTET_31005 [Cymbomonas tetramitiformis]|uniref:Transmembrane protein n=1 Tax=Cymbomonas tetramitiformis TaxID=36881 RepID=A0AAE0FI86_9CHLO|nr:hypothetical protein CYMTET_31005 [Cymbomonas tetramitiformis]